MPLAIRTKYQALPDHNHRGQHSNNLVPHFPWITVPVISVVWMFLLECQSEVAKQLLRCKPNNFLVLAPWIVRKIRMDVDDGNQDNQPVHGSRVSGSNCCNNDSQSRAANDSQCLPQRTSKVWTNKEEPESTLLLGSISHTSLQDPIHIPRTTSYAYWQSVEICR